LAIWLQDNEVEYIIQHGQLQIIEEPVWRHQGGNIKLSAPIANSQDLDLVLVATWNPRVRGQSLLWAYLPPCQPGPSPLLLSWEPSQSG